MLAELVEDGGADMCGGSTVLGVGPVAERPEMSEWWSDCGQAMVDVELSAIVKDGTQTNRSPKEIVGFEPSEMGLRGLGL